MEYVISDLDFKKFSDLVYQKTGINLHYGKKQLLQSRVNKILRKRNINSYKEYFQMITEDQSNQELVDFINLISTNVTHFFREEKHFEFMKKVWKNELLVSKKNTIDIWSSACSSGEEPYSIVIHLKELLDSSQFKINILASDISTKVLGMAKKGIYSQARVENISSELLRRYFQKGIRNGEGFVRIKKELRSLIEFKSINLIEPFQGIKDFDIIFCRNVMIYFDLEIKQKIITNLTNHIKPGGYLFIGHSESLNGLKTSLKYIQPAIYQKVK